MHKATSETYVVRIYRRDTLDPDQVHGLVERAGRRKTQPFDSLQELIEIMSTAPGPRVAVVSGKFRRP